MPWSEGAARAVVYERSGGRCEVCTRPGESVHHRLKRSAGGPWDPVNLLRLCGLGGGGNRCHAWVEGNPAHAMTLGLWVPRGADPATTPVWLRPHMFWTGWWLPDNEGCWTWAGDPPPDHPQNQARDAATAALTRARALQLILPRG